MSKLNGQSSPCKRRQVSVVNSGVKINMNKLYFHLKQDEFTLHYHHVRHHIHPPKHPVHHSKAQADLDVGQQPNAIFHAGLKTHLATPVSHFHTLTRHL